MNRLIGSKRSSWLLLALPITAVGAVAACNGFPVTYDDDSSSSGSTSSFSDDFDGDGVPNDDGCFEGCGQQTVLSAVTPAPLSGGTLLVLRDGKTAIVSDPDRDRVIVVDLTTQSPVVEFQVEVGAQPGRATEDRNGRVHVALRAGGGLLSFDPKAKTPSTFTNVCEAPRGLAASDAADTVYVACASGELFALDTASGLTVKTAAILAPDLRDAVLSGDKLFVSHLRSATIDVVDASTLGLLKSVTPPSYTSLATDFQGQEQTYAPTVAWRMIQRPEGGVIMVHQHSKTSAVVVDPNMGGGYEAGDCNLGILHTAVTMLDGEGNLLNADRAGSLSGLPVPTDIALSNDRSRVAVIGAGAFIVAEMNPQSIIENDGCSQNFPLAIGGGGGIPVDGGTLLDGRLDPTSIEPIAAAYDANDNLVVQTREPAALEIHGSLSGNIVARIELGGESRYDTGYLMFNADPDFAQRPVSCASCHPEGREDGHVWNFEGFGARRTQSLSGGISGTEPLHWDGALANVGAIMEEVFVKRMGGFQQDTQRVAAITRFIDSFPDAPHVPAPAADAVARGKVLFEDSTVGCADCHTGDRLTNNETVDVGTGLKLQVPSLLGVGARAPFMHDGCATDLEARFGGYCGGGDAHGMTSQLDAAAISDLVAYLKSL